MAQSSGQRAQGKELRARSIEHSKKIPSWEGFGVGLFSTELSNNKKKSFYPAPSALRPALSGVSAGNIFSPFFNDLLHVLREF